MIGGIDDHREPTRVPVPAAEQQFATKTSGSSVWIPAAQLPKTCNDNQQASAPQPIIQHIPMPQDSFPQTTVAQATVQEIPFLQTSVQQDSAPKAII
jgi:hypothetical protein